MSHLAILIGLVLGVGLGVAASATASPVLMALAAGVSPIGDVFLRAIQMVVIPLVVVTIFLGVVRLGDLRKLGRVGGISVAYFWATTFVAILIGMALMRFALLFAATAAPPPAKGPIAPAELPGMVEFLVNLVPRNPFEAASSGALLPMIVFTVLFSAAAGTLSEERRARLLDLGESISEALIRLVRWILWMTPAGVFGLAAPMIARSGVVMLQSLALFVAVVIVGLFGFMAAVLLPAARLLGGVTVRRFVAGTLGTYSLGFGTTSSVATLPMMLQEAEEKLGLSDEVSTLVLPLAASINRPGSALFQGAAVVFLASLYGVSVPAPALAAAALATFLAAMSVAPVPSSSIFTMAPALDVAGVPAAGLGLLLGIDRIPDMFRTGTNCIGHVSAAAVVDGIVGGGRRVPSEGDAAHPRTRTGAAERRREEAIALESRYEA